MWGEWSIGFRVVSAFFSLGGMGEWSLGFRV